MMFMSRKVLFPVLCALMAGIAIISVININSPDTLTPAPQISGPSSQDSTPSPSIYEIKLTGGNICLYTLDERGSEIDCKTLSYIDIHSLQEFLLDQLRSGTKFESREAVAEFIQDLDS